MKIAIEFYIFKLVQVLNLNFNKQFRFFGTNFPPKKILLVKNRKVNITIEFFIFELV